MNVSSGHRPHPATASLASAAWTALFGAALLAYPRSHRRQFGAELLGLSRDRLAACWVRSPRRAVLLAALDLGDALADGAAERWRSVTTWWAWPRHHASRTERTTSMSWESLGNDLRLALRQCRRAPLFTALTVASLALGIGANSAMFAVVNAVLLRPLPYQDPGALVAVWSDNTNRGEHANSVSPANFEAFRAAPSFAAVEGMYAFLTPAQVRIDAEPEVVQASTVTPGMFALLGRDALLGRTFRDGDPDATVVLSYRFWQRRLGGDPGVVGRTIAMTGSPTPLTVLGVMPEDFVFPYRSMLVASGFTRANEADGWVQMTRHRDPRLVDASGQPNRSIHYLAVIGRLRAGASIDKAREELATIARQRAIDFPDTNSGWAVTARPLHEQAVGALRPALIILLAGVAVVLLITCINVANVLLARAAGRGRDLAIRTALGASRRRLVQQMLVESVVLAAAGGAAGLGLMVIATRAMIALAPATLPRLGEVTAGMPVLVFAAVVSLATGVAVGVLPAFAAAHTPAQDALREGGRTTSSRTRRRVRAVLIVAEVALAMTLTIGGGLLLRSFISVLHVDPGFQAGHLLTLQVNVPPRYGDVASQLQFYDELESRVRALPGVTAIGGTTRLPLGSTGLTTMIEVQGSGKPRAEWPEVEMRRAVFDFFGAMQIPILRGRAFSRQDDMMSMPVAVVNSVCVMSVFGGEDPIGKQVRLGGNGRWLTIVGVTGSIKHGTLEETPRPELYITYRQGPPVSPYLAIRTSGDAAQLAPAVRQVMRDLNANPPTDLRTMDEIRSRSVAERRFVLVLVAVFGVLALGLAALGVYGVITLVTAERTAEVGIRLALGAMPSQVLNLLLGHALRLALAGIAIGGLLALALTPLLEAQLFGITRSDPVTYAAVSATLAGTAVLAALVPARRAMHVDPAQTLRR